MKFSWKRCQECGAKAIAYVDRHNFGDDKGEDFDNVKCTECNSDGDGGTTWDEYQAATRARKRFELVRASMMHLDIHADYTIIKGADDVLIQLYGEVPEGGRDD